MFSCGQSNSTGYLALYLYNDGGDVKIQVVRGGNAIRGIATILVVDTILPNVTLFVNDTTVEYGNETIHIDWNVTELNLDYKVINISYPNGTLLDSSVDDTVNITLNGSNLTTFGVYSIII